MTKRAVGEFDVKVDGLAVENAASDTLGRMSLAKQYRGDLQAEGAGQMLTAMSSVKGSAAYVAIEHVRGRLDGRDGAFALVHRGVMNRGTADPLVVTIVPDSGTGGLEGLSGTMAIIIEGKKHSYELEYSLPGA